MLSELVAIPFANDDTLLSIDWMPIEFVLMFNMFDVAILLRVSMLFELITIPSLKDVTLSFIAVII